MPIHCPVKIDSLSAEEFEKLDYRIMGHAYASQNELGRLCDECAYHADLQARLLADGFQSVLTEVPVTVTYRDFSKRYFLDLVANNAVYELKVATTLVGEHETQLFNYLFLLGIPRGKLLNFRPLKVQGKIVATSLTHKERRSFMPITGRWKDLDASCRTLRETVIALLEDWGAFLDFSLYQEALVHFLGGENNVEKSLALRRGELGLGTQKMSLHSPDVAFRITAYTENQTHIETHLRRLLALTNLKAIQWINLNHAQIEFTTLSK